MNDFHDVLDRKRREVRPPPDAFDRLIRTRERRKRNRRIATFVAVALVLGLTGWVFRSAIGLRSAQDTPAGPIDVARTRVVGSLPAGPGVVTGVAVLAKSVWVGSSAVPGVVRLDPVTGQELARVRTHAPIESGIDVHPLISDVLAAFGSIWTVDEEFGTLSRIDPRVNAVIATIPLGRYPNAVAQADGALWVVSGADGTVWRVDPSLDEVTATIDLSRNFGAEHSDIAVHRDGVWVTIDDEVIRIDPRNARIVNRVEMPGPAGSVAVNDEGVWVVLPSMGSVARIDPAADRIAETVSVGVSPTGVNVSHGVVWVSDVRDQTLRGIDPPTGRVVISLPVGRGAGDVAASAESLWVLNQIDATITHIHVERAAP